MASYQVLYQKLSEFISTSRKNNVDYTIALTLLKHIDHLTTLTIDDVAVLANTTPSSVTKFCKKIGYSSYKSMRYDQRKFGKSSLIEYRDNDTVSDYLNRYHENQEKLNALLFNAIDNTTIEKLAREIYEKKQVTVFETVYSHDHFVILRTLLNGLQIDTIGIGRESEETILNQAAISASVIIIPCLTLSYFTENQSLFKTYKDKIYILTSQQIENYNCIYPQQVDMMFESYDMPMHLLEVFNLKLYYYLQKVSKSGK